MVAFANVISIATPTPMADNNRASRPSSTTWLQPSSPAPRSVKSRTGCEQCKKRRVKCDEKQPTCSRCEARGETCTGNFRLDQWQIERPWVTAEGASIPGSTLENETLRYWYDTACLTMAMFPPPMNPLSYPLSSLLRRSKALRHTVQCVADAHQNYFTKDTMAQALQERNLAIVSLQGEVARIQSSTRMQAVLLRTTILSSLILCVSSGWFDPSGTDCGADFLFGVKGIIHLLLTTEPSDPLAFYVMGLLLYWEAFSSFLIPVARRRPVSQDVASLLLQSPFRSMVHPVTGLATSLCPIITEVGQHYRRVVETGQLSVSDEERVRCRLQDWTPPLDQGCAQRPWMLQIAEAYKNICFIMLHQARGVIGQLHGTDARDLSDTVLSVIRRIQDTPREDVVINWAGPALLIAGSELHSGLQDERRLVETYSLHLENVTRIPTYRQSQELIREVWQLRDNGFVTSWLEVMVERGLSFPVG
ncbi:hypothetical protein ACJ41O_014342 [Fusarium nematophilum]